MQNEMMTNKEKLLFSVIKNALWHTEVSDLSEDGQEIYTEMSNHCILALPGQSIMDYHLPAELRHQWEKNIILQMTRYVHYTAMEKQLPISVPYVILKGTAASQYYPNPELRAMGDIDIMTRREDCDVACAELCKNGYSEIPILSGTSKHRAFRDNKGGPEVEVHFFFAARSDIDEARFIDDLIIDAINPTHFLPDMINGLVLLEHINYHLEYGLGLRQILDWMMFVDRCLTDEAWPSFLDMIRGIRLETLAIVLTKMCEMYLGLSERCWTAGADLLICERLMRYVLLSGNFGNKQADANNAKDVMYMARSPASVFKLLQRRGLQNWQMAQKYCFLRPFAWAYQIHRYIAMFVKHPYSISDLRKQYNDALDKRELFDALKVKQISKGVIVYRKGHYKKV